jgi:hypothetical protein
MYSGDYIERSAWDYRLWIVLAFLRGHREKFCGLLVDVFATTLRAFDLALFVFRKAQDNLERLLAIFAVKLIAGHDDLRRTPDGDGSKQASTPREWRCQGKCTRDCTRWLADPAQVSRMDLTNTIRTSTVFNGCECCLTGRNAKGNFIKASRFLP